MRKHDIIFRILNTEYVKVIVPLVIALQLMTEPVRAQNELDVVKDSWLEFTDTRNSLYHYLSGKAYLLLKNRAEQISGITTLEQWQQRQRE